MTTRRARLTEAVEALGSGQESPRAYAEACCDRVAEIDPEVRALVPEDDRRERVLAAATDVGKRFPDTDERPPLFGVPVGVKDIVHVDGLHTRAGSELPPDVLAGPEAAVVGRLRDAGAVVLGKTVTTEFAYFAPGPTRNPHALEHTPGGSSSGSAAAVAAGLCPLAIGTQTMGSVIRPAAFCGVIGVKPSFGRVPIEGVVPVSPSLDTLGAFTQDVSGARLAASVLCPDWAGPEEVPDSPVLGVPDDTYLDRADAVGRERFEGQIEALEAEGFEIDRTTALSDIERLLDVHETLMAAEMADTHETWYNAYGDRYATETVELIETGLAAPESAVESARAGRAQLRGSRESTMAEHGIDAWVAPAAPGPAPRGIDDTGDPVMNASWTYAGLPAVTVPAGDVDGLPLGIQLVGAFGGDEALLGLAASVDEAIDGS